MRTVFTHTDRTGSELTIVQAQSGDQPRRYTIRIDRLGIAAVSHHLDAAEFDALVTAARTFPGTDAQ